MSDPDLQVSLILLVVGLGVPVVMLIVAAGIEVAHWCSSRLNPRETRGRKRAKRAP